MSNVVRFPAKPETPQLAERMAWKCANCGSFSFNILIEGEIECDGCEVTLADMHAVHNDWKENA